MAKNTLLVKNLCKNPRKSLCKFLVKVCGIINQTITMVEKPTFPPTFTSFPTIFSTKTTPLFLTNIIHFFTDPTITITTINKLEERN